MDQPTHSVDQPTHSTPERTCVTLSTDKPQTEADRRHHDLATLIGLRDSTVGKAQECVEKYNLKLPGDPYAYLGDDFVEETIRAMKHLPVPRIGD